jgi:hypothetical protein
MLQWQPLPAAHNAKEEEAVTIRPDSLFGFDEPE